MARNGVGVPLWVDPTTAASEPPPAEEAQAVEAVSDEFEPPKVNGFTEGEATAHQTLTVSRDSER